MESVAEFNMILKQTYCHDRHYTIAIITEVSIHFISYRTYILRSPSPSAM